MFYNHTAAEASCKRLIYLILRFCDIKYLVILLLNCFFLFFIITPGIVTINLVCINVQCFCPFQMLLLSYLQIFFTSASFVVVCLASLVCFKFFTLFTSLLALTSGELADSFYTVG